MITIMQAFRRIVEYLYDQIDRRIHYVTPEMYGALGDGTTNDIEAFNQALQTEKSLRLKNNKTYYLDITDTPIHVFSNTIINGNNAVLKVKTTNGILSRLFISETNTENVTIKNLVVKTDRDINYTGPHGSEYLSSCIVGVSIYNGSKNITIDNCIFDGTEYGIRLTEHTEQTDGYSENISITNVKMKDVGIGLAGGGDVRGYHVDNIKIETASTETGNHAVYLLSGVTGIHINNFDIVQTETEGCALSFYTEGKTNIGTSKVLLTNGRVFANALGSCSNEYEVHMHNVHYDATGIVRTNTAVFTPFEQSYAYFCNCIFTNCSFFDFGTYQGCRFEPSYDFAFYLTSTTGKKLSVSDSTIVSKSYVLYTTANLIDSEIIFNNSTISHSGDTNKNLLSVRGDTAKANITFSKCIIDGYTRTAYSPTNGGNTNIDFDYCHFITDSTLNTSSVVDTEIQTFLYCTITDINGDSFLGNSTSEDISIDTIIPYVTPEMFGAVGDGTTDDTVAFATAIETGKPIICASGKTYYFTSEIITNLIKINLDANYCQFKNFRLKINVNEDETGWINEYPHPDNVIKNIYFINDGMDYCIKTGIPLHLMNISAYNYDLWLKNYGTYMDYMVFDNIMIMNHIGTSYAIELSYLGDQHVFRECHLSGGTNNKFIQISGCKASTFINCLNGSYMIYESVVNFIGCHYEEDGIVEIGDPEDNLSSIVNFNGCFFWDNYTITNRKGITYNGCEFFINFRSYKGENDYLTLNTNNCIIICNTTGAGTESFIELDELKRNTYEYTVWSGNKVVLEASSSLLTNDQKTWGISSGIYIYTFFQSNNPYSIEYGDFINSKTEISYTITEEVSAIKFRIDYTQYKGMYLHTFRTNPDNTISYAIVPITGAFVFDYGKTLNGIQYKVVASIPNPANTTAIYRNGIYYYNRIGTNATNCLCVNTETGEMKYITSDGNSLSIN